ncbi:TonB-dependent receptor, partial [Litorivivens sp.]|uniref:TonB-dependent receptor n=1 Tax=Litorivivens sp. TaxID=2020868 RepID=UPI003563F15A
RNDLAAQGFNRDILVDPRSFAVKADTELWIARLDWDATDALQLSYLYGYADHKGGGAGVQADYKSTQGDNIFPLNTPTTVFNSNPEEILEASSHELQLNWDSGGALQLRGGLYYSAVEDSSWNTFWFIAPCNSEANCKDGVTTSDPVLLNLLPPGNGHGKKSHLKHYKDDIYALFTEVSYDFTDRLTMTLEARYTLEEKSFHQETSSFGAPEALRDEENFSYFTPRFTVQYSIWNKGLIYGSAGKGVKTGGFNTIDPDINPDQSTYDEEENWAFELGSKNTLLEGSLQLNIAAFYIDWSDQQGTESANDPDPFASDVLGNIGDAEVYGVELESVYYFTHEWFVDAGYTYNNPTFTNAAYSPAVNDTNSAYGCDNQTCPADGDVSGNMLQRASKQQASLGINYRGDIAGWSLDARLAANYRSKMYATPLNLGHNGDRTVANLSVSLSRNSWDLTLWGKNIFDTQYVANTFVLPSFSGYIVGLGPRDTWGLSARYQF